MRIDAVVTAGDGKAARRLFKKNKALLDVAGKPIIRHIVETLLKCDEIDRIVVVGPREEFLEVIGDLDVDIVQQKRSLAENGWEGFLHTIPEFRSQGLCTEEIIEKYRDKYVLFLSGDIPLISVREIKEFLSKCDMERYDYIAGATSEEILKLFGPRKGKPGIKMATFRMRDGNLRQNNLHMARPFVLIESIDLVLKAYEYRYQKEFVNIIRSLFEIVRLGRKSLAQTLGIYLLLQISAGLSALGFERAARIASWPVTRARMERLISNLLNTRFRIAETTVGGAALDVDNEKDYMTLSIMYKDWMNQIAQGNHHLA
ncbi:MAG: 2-C-methyl-D-erythritol 4-phosphate cytidylyltransferase [Deltaproteobacteria bacterium ADurb.BinA179]|jgi:CTP:molybdopterin cytidylyltransferase MocA|nr:nucleotidyltransferase family protein [Pseudomonadota bacterium]OPZ29321.1 MAG: 2-C-methyl-D-erythritol 4-phosphate cytidylyltransferase [Deltaproteobacteria bacterium ADurb.BinA179]HNU74443.1 nucleotidyltransferase family protein [Deltaproteobacteria bacterium]HOD69425.1 nucleotidyltransferase family protein [Deltaproteobacteria bacterium]HOE71284.1 nucleotidyltransferase family protein [Deltaproteobacteria bacterium]